VHQPSGQPTSGLLLLQTLLPFFGWRLKQPPVVPVGCHHAAP